VANEEHLARLKQGVAAWNAWRKVNLNIRPDLSQANLSLMNLTKVDLAGADLSGANIREADLTKADLTEAVLCEADLTRAVLLRANLSGANLHGVDLTRAALTGAVLIKAALIEADLHGAVLTGADLSGANLTGARLINTHFEKANLTGCRVYAISAWNVTLVGAQQSNLIITPRDEPRITVDNLDVAQFIYLLLHNDKIREVIDTIGKKGVLILGRFAGERKAVLDALRTALRHRNFLPMVFDFEKPTQRDFTETIMTLAGLCLFVIADITNPRSAPLELQATVPDYIIPFVPIIAEGESPFSMFIDLQRKFDWVLDVLTYDSVDHLLAGLEDAVIIPALQKHEALVQRRAQAVGTRHIQQYLPHGEAHP
jgi:Pentapeptide repeats (8 copies)